MVHHHQHVDLTDEQARAMFEQPSWEERYSGPDPVWSGNPNPQLVGEVESLPVGTALDVGCGEGGDAIWLARRGWQVTALDFAAAALERTRRHATQRAEADGDPAMVGRIAFEQADIRTWRAGGRTWDLVSAQYMHQPEGGMVPIVFELGTAVASGGTLLIVGHHPRDLDSGLRMRLLGSLIPSEDFLPGLDPAEWSEIRTETRDRAVVTPDGDKETVYDAVLVARRR